VWCQALIFWFWHSKYDRVGNRTNSNPNGLSTFNQANQLLDDANFTYQYDNNGNMTCKTATGSGASP